ncbi:hypothetical protein Athai_07690 [Actinocatenispora thailandica]|uniref:Knr4/Smi1-like domain-containing protein n=1 Tax=Actinocatenispora thailandica TaxID=227318 RepID=A0A7R7DKH9_9ACTN|nr:SMI1/KNR4 family protein [Actinocatenispora thailandica]BCJ33266.1 hypothetical protein Athai_07690 [Actinocatenispora thailandica]
MVDDSADDGPLIPGAAFAAQIRQFDQPSLRMRYREGVVVNAYGFPEWDLLARAMVQLPELKAELTIDEQRVLDVLTANEVMVKANDPLWTFTADDYVALSPPGWVWVHLPRVRRLALVPAEVHGAFRHLGGAALLKVPRARRGVRIDDATPVPMDYTEQLADSLVDRLERRLGFPLPPAYRTFLASTNGATPTTPGIHPDQGFVLDQPFFGLGRGDRMQDLVYVSGWFGDRFTADFLPIGYVQGGILAVRVAGDDIGSVWYHDDDDYRDDDRYDAEYISANLLYRCADDFDAFLHALAVAPKWLLELVDDAVEAGRASALRPSGLGASLPADARAPR